MGSECECNFWIVSKQIYCKKTTTLEINGTPYCDFHHDFLITMRKHTEKGLCNFNMDNHPSGFTCMFDFKYSLRGMRFCDNHYQQYVAKHPESADKFTVLNKFKLSRADSSSNWRSNSWS